MLGLSGSFGRRILIGSTITFPIAGTQTCIRVKGQLFDPGQELRLILWDRRDVRAGFSKATLQHPKCSFSRLLRRSVHML